MPIYEYNCLKCGLRFDYLMRSNNEPILCPGCSGKELKRLVSTFAFTSRDASGNVTAASGGCSSCLKPNCSTCSKDK